MKEHYVEQYMSISYFDIAKEENTTDNLIEVKSSVIKAVRYDNKMLLVNFRNGTSYVYSGVDADTVVKLLGASSKGKFYQQNIKKVYPCMRVL